MTTKNESKRFFSTTTEEKKNKKKKIIAPQIPLVFFFIAFNMLLNEVFVFFSYNDLFSFTVRAGFLKKKFFYFVFFFEADVYSLDKIVSDSFFGVFVSNISPEKPETFLLYKAALPPIFFFEDLL